MASTRPTCSRPTWTQEKAKGRTQGIVPDRGPGASTGVPPDLVKGYQAPPEPVTADQSIPAGAPGGPPGGPKGAAPAATADATADAAAEEPKPKPKPKVARAKASDPIWDRKPAAVAKPASRPTQIEVNRSAAPPAAPAAQQPQQGASPWPDPQPEQQQAGQSDFPRRLRLAHSPLIALGYLSAIPNSVGFAEIRLHRRHRRPAQCRQVDAVQPAGRQAAGAGRRPPGRHPRPARGRGAARRSRLHRDRHRRLRRGGARQPDPAACGRRPRRAIDDADAVLFLIDARAGLTADRPRVRRCWCARPASR